VYSFVVSNTGNAPLYGIDIQDPLVEVQGGPIDLAPGQSDSTTFTAVLYPTDEQLADGVLTNTAEAVGATVLESIVTATDSHVAVFPPEEDETPPWEDPGYTTDFVLRSIDLVPSPSLVGARFKAVVLVANEGNLPADAGTLEVWPVEAQYAARPAGSSERSLALGVIQPGEVVAAEFTNLRAPAEKGTYHAMAVINASEVKPEWSYGNNHAGATYTLEPLTVATEATAEGMLLTWNSTPGHYYFVERAETLGAPYIDLAQNLDATPPVNQYLDTDPPAGGGFYRVWGYKP
jgi:hypothetical protein